MSLIFCHQKQCFTRFSCCDSDTISLGYGAKGHTAQSICRASILLDTEKFHCKLLFSFTFTSALYVSSHCSRIMQGWFLYELGLGRNSSMSQQGKFSLDEKKNTFSKRIEGLDLYSFSPKKYPQVKIKTGYVIHEFKCRHLMHYSIPFSPLDV